MNIKSKIKLWYLGGPLPIKEINKDGSETYRQPNEFSPTQSAIVAQWVVKHLMPIIAMLVAALIALFIHFDGKTTSKSHNEKTQGVSHNINQIKIKNR